MNKYCPVLIHSHTYHSDGTFSPNELVDAAKEFGYEALFITDHNTNTAFDEVKNRNDIKIFPGFELTSFYGHVLVLGDERLWDYTKLKEDNLEEFVKENSKSKNLAIGLAHPYDMGGPFCTGCHLDFRIGNIDNFAYMEIFNGPNPNDSYSNQMAYDKWVSLTNKGHKLAVLGGRDWHGLEDKSCNYYVNMIKAGKLSKDEVINSIKESKTYITMGPILNLNIEGDRNLDLGDVTYSRDFDIKISLSRSSFNLEKDIVIEKLIIKNNEDDLFVSPISYDEEKSIKLSAKEGNLRFIIEGKIDKKDVRLLVTSAIFLERNKK